MGDELTLDLGSDYSPPDPKPKAARAGKARATDPPTAQAAALANPGPRGELRGRILETFFEYPHKMFTVDELVVEIDTRWPPLDGAPGVHLGSVDRRRAELVEMGWLEQAGSKSLPLTRATRRGVSAIVWCLTKAGRADGWTT